MYIQDNLSKVMQMLLKEYQRTHLYTIMNERLPLGICIYKIGKKGLPSVQILHMVAEMYFSSFRDIQKDLRDFLSCRLGNYASLLRVKGIHRLGLLLSFKRCPEPVYFLRFVTKKKQFASKIY